MMKLPRKLVLVSDINDLIKLVDDINFLNYKVALFSQNTTIFKDYLSKVTLFNPHKPSACLGQDFQGLIFDAQQGFSLDAFLCASSCLLAQGLCIIYLPNWENWEDFEDPQTQRFDSNTLYSPKFHHYLKMQLQKYTDLILIDSSTEQRVLAENLAIFLNENLSSNLAFKSNNFELNQEQSVILSALNFALEKQQLRCLITGQRGSGKSTLMHCFLKALSNKQQVILCSAKKNNIQNIDPSFERDFYAPDLLFQTLQTSPKLLKDKLLIIEEAATLPLSLLKQLLIYSSQIILITTLDNYEGTGLGFTHKLLEWQLLNDVHILRENMRFDESDNLSQMAQKLSLLENKMAENILTDFKNIKKTENSHLHKISNEISFQKYYEKALNTSQISKFYQLLFTTHYRTHPLDIRRLFDASGQSFLFYKSDSLLFLIAGAWLLNEGEIDESLAQEIYLNTRRPQGNLSVQMLAAHNRAPEACGMKVLRISRISVDKKYQQQGIGQKLVADIIQEAMQNNIDYVSVVFGFEPHLLKFWQKCGFIWGHLGSHQDHITAEHAILMLYPLSIAAKKLSEKLSNQFLIDQLVWQHANFINPSVKLAFSFENQFNNADDINDLSNEDWQQLYDLGRSNRSLLANFPVLYRLYQYHKANQTNALVTNYPINHIKDFIAKNSDENFIPANLELSQKAKMLAIRKEILDIVNFKTKVHLPKEK